MNFLKTDIEGVYIIEPVVFGDHRGYFMETFRQDLFDAAVGPVAFVQENESYSRYGVVRGLHFQAEPYAQAKLVRVIRGRVWDVALDIRPGSPTFGRHIGVELSGENHRQFFVPRGFAHGFAVLSEDAVFAYKVDNVYAPQAERSIRFDDPEVGIAWPVPAADRICSEKDLRAPSWREVFPALI